MSLWVQAILLTLFIASPPWRIGFVNGKIDPNDKGEPLFKEGHPNITYLTDGNFDDMMSKYSDRPWLVDFYHPFCPHCKHFVPTYEELAAHYKIEGSIYLGAVSCMDHVKCRRVAINGFPTLMAIGFDKKRPMKEVKRIVGTHTFQEVVDFVNENFREAAFNETGTYPPTSAPVQADPDAKATEMVKEAVPGEQVRKEIWEESTKPMNQTTRLQDAASAFIFGLKQGIFMGREVLEDVELDALKAWLLLVSQTFPGSINRKLVRSLYDEVEGLALLDFDRWDEILNAWQMTSYDKFEAEEAQFDWNHVDAAHVPSWQRLNSLFLGQGVTYRACALYTCGQWNMFHMLTMNPVNEKRSDELLVSVIATMRRFMKHFFGCVQCRDHFLEYNNLERVKEIKAATNKPMALKRWLWTMHNAVNERIRHPLWPKPNICPTCREHNDEWIQVEVDKWLGREYEFNEVAVPLLATKKPLLRGENDKQVQTIDPKEVKSEKKQMESELEQIAEQADPIAPTEPHQPSKTKEKSPEGVWKPKDAAQGVDNPALKSHQPVAQEQANVQAQDSLQGVRAPPVSLFTWYILPVAAVGAYLLFVRSRQRTRGFRHHARE